jgi:hypothetical protein
VETVRLHPCWGEIGFFFLSSVLLLATKTTDASKKRFFLALRKTDRQKICWREGYAWSGKISRKKYRIISDEGKTAFLN